MKFMGSKRRIAKYILPIMLEQRENRVWVEPFVGGGNMLEKVDGYRIGADYDRNVISALTTIRDRIHDIPKNSSEFTENDYRMLRTHDFNGLNGYLGFALSYGGKWMGGWSRHDASGVKHRDYVSEAYRSAVKQSDRLKNTILVHSSYDSLVVPPNSLIYCDPPYSGTTGYKGGFNHDKFWNWCRHMSSLGHRVFISEYSAPNDFKCIWSGEITTSLTKDSGGKRGIEKLFIYE